MMVPAKPRLTWPEVLFWGERSHPHDAFASSSWCSNQWPLMPKDIPTGGAPRIYI